MPRRASRPVTTLNLPKGGGIDPRDPANKRWKKPGTAIVPYSPPKSTGGAGNVRPKSSAPAAKSPSLMSRALSTRGRRIGIGAAAGVGIFAAGSSMSSGRGRSGNQSLYG